MLRCLSFPPNVYIELRVGDDEFTLPFVEYMQLVISMLVFSLFSHFTSVISGGNGICTCAIDIDGRAGKENEPSFTFSASHTTPEALDASPTTLPSPTFHLTFCGQRENGLQHCIYLLKTLAFLPGIIYAPILIVWPHPLLMTQPAHWRDGLSEFSHLRIIKILGQAVYGFVGALDGQNSDAPPLFPNLGEVDIEDVDLTTTYATQAQRSNPPGMGPFEGTGSHMPVVDRLAAAVKWRAALGCPPIVFTIRRCNVTQGQIDGLMGAVEPGLSVVWDREVEGLTEKQLTN
ncbi:hypothetical protein OF83DRAFT_1286236 [Amylostereum chailletii]|nr:hypothetical protein OF83DRAFT_1286236 [Amylostereum chailletii]